MRHDLAHWHMVLSWMSGTDCRLKLEPGRSRRRDSTRSPTSTEIDIDILYAYIHDLWQKVRQKRNLQALHQQGSGAGVTNLTPGTRPPIGARPGFGQVRDR